MVENMFIVIAHLMLNCFRESEVITNYSILQSTELGSSLLQTPPCGGIPSLATPHLRLMAI